MSDHTETRQGSPREPEIDGFDQVPTGTEAINEYVRNFRKLFCDGHVKGEFLFQDYWEYFGNWTLNDFKRIDKEERLYLRDDLRYYGVYVERRKGVNAAQALLATIEAEENIWPKDQEDIQTRSQTGPDSDTIQTDQAQDQEIPDNQENTNDNTSTIFIKSVERVQEGPTRKVAIRPPTGTNDSRTRPNPAQPNALHEDIYDAETLISTRFTNHQNGSIKRENTYDTGQEPLRTLPDWGRGEALPDPTPAQSRYPRDGTLPPFTTNLNRTGGSSYPNRPSWYVMESLSTDQAKALVNLAKMYTKELQYSGAKDHLDEKLHIFADLCQRAAVELSIWNRAFPSMLRDGASTYYYRYLQNKGFSFDELVAATRRNYETEERANRFLSRWFTLTFDTFREESYQRDKPVLAQLENYARELQSLQLGLKDDNMRTDKTLRDKLIQGVSGNSLFKMALFNAPATFPTLMDGLRACVGIETTHRSPSGTSPIRGRTHVTTQESANSHYSDRKMKFSQGNKRGNTFQPKPGYTGCIVCKKQDCHSSRHTEEERAASKAQYFANRKAEGYKPSDKSYKAYLARKGSGGDSEPDTEDESQGMQSSNPEDEESEDERSDGTANYTTVFTASKTKYDARDVLSQLEERKAKHILASRIRLPTANNAFTTQWTDHFFQGLLIDTGASNRNTGGLNQLKALQRIQNVKLDTSQAGKSRITFGAGSRSALGVATVNTPAGIMDFTIVDADIPFLVCLQQLDKLNAQYDNLRNVLIQGEKRHLIVRKQGHPWLLLDKTDQLLNTSSGTINSCHLTETEIRRLHRRFGHPSVQRLHHLLDQAGHTPDSDIMERVREMCEHCQKHADAPHRFRFKLQDDIDFNHTVYVDIAQFGERYALHMVDEATGFGAAKWLRNAPGSQTAKAVFDAFKLAWMDTYIGPPEFVVYDYGTNFNSEEFRTSLRAMGSIPKLVPVEAHHSIGKVERYHRPLRRAYEIITAEQPDLSDEIRLQMAVKAVNDTAGPSGLIPTLLVFGAFPRLTELDPPNPSVEERAIAIKKAMKEVRRIHATRKVNDALATRNGPGTTQIHNLRLNDQVLVWREDKGWKGPYTFLGMERETCQIEIEGKTKTFRSTSVRPFKTDEFGIEKVLPEKPITITENPSTSETVPKPIRLVPRVEIPMMRPLRGIPTIDDDYDKDATIQIAYGDISAEVFLTEKETRDRELSKRLREEGKITTPGQPFQQSRQKEYEGLMKRGVFVPIHKDDPTVQGKRIFKSRMVDEIKGKETDQPFEKSRLVVQAWNDQGKKEEGIITQSPTIQRASQRLIICLAASVLPLLRLRNSSGSLGIRDVTQAYTQASSKLLRDIFVWPPADIAIQFPAGTVFKVVLPLYGIPESGNHWFSTYYRHHQESLRMSNSTYDPCLMITTDSQANTPFGIVGMQTDDTLILGDKDFFAQEATEIQRAGFLTKPIQLLNASDSLTFNGCIIRQDKDDLYMSQKGQGVRIDLIDTNKQDYKQDYLEQRARGAYLASICQPEASYSLSAAAQHQNPTKEDVQALNKCLQWQRDNLQKGLRYLPLDLTKAKLFAFVDGSFANNHDLSSQIGYIILVGTESEGNADFTVTGNIVHTSSTKCKRVTRAVLASELYAMVAGIDMLIALSTTINQVTDKLRLPRLPTVVCTDSLSLYECIVKLGTTKEKRLMIDIMAIRQSYERRELTEIRWIDGSSNPADAMTKSNPNKALQQLVDSNRLTVKVEGWIQRPTGADSDL